MVNLFMKSSLKSPVPHLLKTNDPPNELEMSAINKAVANAQRELDDILLGSDRTRVTQLAKFIRVHRAVLAPVRRVPFELFVPVLFYAFWDETIDIIHPPFLLAHVCRLWRGIIFDRKMLDLATIPPPLRLTGSGRSLLQGRKRHVIRSCANSPISFDVLDHTEGDHHPALDTLICRPTPWKSVSLDLNISSLRFLDENLNHDRIQHLSRLKLKVAPPFACSSSAFLVAPALTEVEIECQHKLLLFLPWKKIRSYRERSSFDIGVSLVLRYAIELEHLAYSTTNPSPFVTQPLPSTLPHLKVLDIKIYHEDPTIALQLTTPRLEEFILRDHGQDSINRIREHLHRSRCGPTLKRLAFHVGNFRADILTQILGSLPNLEELECNDIPSKDLERLGREEPIKLAPRLRRLIVHQPSNAAAIDILITSRSEFQPTEHTLLGSKKPGLDRVSLVFSDPEECDTVAVALGVQDPSPRNDLIKMRKAMTQLDLACKSGPAGMSDDQASGVNKTLSKLETFKFKNPREIDLRAVNIVKRFWWHASENGPLEKKYQFTDRARALWDVWKAILSTHGRQATGTRWIRDESNSLLYLKAVQEDHTAFERDLLSAPWQDNKGFQASWPYTALDL